MADNRPWLIEPRIGSASPQADLLTALNHAADFAPFCQPRNTSEALRIVALAIAREQDLVLFDTDFSADEILALGYSPERLAERVPLAAAPVITEESLARLAAGASRARLGLFTSGSTGLPKLVWQPISNLARGVRTGGRHVESVWTLAYNPTHIAGLQVFLQALANGCPLVDVFGLDRAGVLAALESEGVTHVSATPSFYRLLLPIERPLGRVVSVTLGGESSDQAFLQRLRALFPAARFHNVYASTEAGTLLVAEDDVFAIAPSLEGRVRLADGRVHVHRSLLGEFAGRGLEEWYDTGDVVEITSESPLRFRIVARQRDWINVGGNKVNPREVEGVLEQHAAVARARVFGRSNSVVGSLLCAEIVLQPGAQVAEAQLREFAGTRLQPVKVPRMVRFVAELAATRTGKLSRS
jgi:acyl-CoA synthetase (AMP-forming)/AMP-acid ligase II